ncbi:hypothetical protein [Oligoflexus tunisiensis]|uniref:hypothetical protein n=1 Tax=Oligoflexus tunisiensis TaxID=708132 RepID=UPI001C404C14|nr:hypothetical protein [Oligoflexus tunisiensis]
MSSEAEGRMKAVEAGWKKCESQLMTSRNLNENLSDRIQTITDDLLNSKQSIAERNLEIKTARDEINTLIGKFKEQDEFFQKVEADPNNPDLKKELVQQYFVSSNIDDVFKQTIDSGLRSTINPPPGMKEDVEKIFSKYYSWDVIKPIVQDGYMKSLEPSEIIAMIRFNQTESGRMLTQKLPAINMQITAEVVQNLERNKLIMAKELSELKAKYDNDISKDN